MPIKEFGCSYVVLPGGVIFGHQLILRWKAAVESLAEEFPGDEFLEDWFVSLDSLLD